MAWKEDMQKDCWMHLQEHVKCQMNLKSLIIKKWLGLEFGTDYFTIKEGDCAECQKIII